MQYFKHIELIRLYNISDKTVRNWIDSAVAGKINLEIYEKNGRSYIANTLGNNAILDNLAARSKKYRNKRAHRSVCPDEDFYRLYESSEIRDIISTLEAHRELPHQYRYKGEGAKYWDQYLHKLYSSGTNNMLLATSRLLHLTLPYLLEIANSYKHINVIDVGVGNALVLKDFLQLLGKSGKLKKYVGIDISSELLDIAESNVRQWLGDSIIIEKYIRDISWQRFSDATMGDSFGEDAANSINFVLFLGGIMPNFRRPEVALDTIRNSINKNDLLLVSDKLDTDAARRFFDFSINGDKQKLARYNQHLLSLMGISDDLYEVEHSFDEKEMSRQILIKFKVAVSLNFEVGSFKKTLDIPKGERVLLWRGTHFSAEKLVDVFQSQGFNTLQTTKIKGNEEYLMLTFEGA